MSKKFLYKLLEEEIQYLSKYSDEFKQGKVVEEYHIAVSVSSIRTEIYRQVNSYISNSSKELDTLITKHSREIVKDLYNHYVSIPGATIVGRITDFRVAIRGRYKKPKINVRALQKDLNKILKEGIPERENSILERRLSERINRATFIKNTVTPVEVTFTKRDLKTKTIFTTSINRPEYLTALQKAVARLSTKYSPADWEGSSSRRDIEKGKIIESFEKHKTKKSKKPPTGTTKVSKTIKQKVRRRKVEESVPKLKLRAAKKSAINLKALINEKLTDQVASNMGLPALRYRTGRFASSQESAIIPRS